VCPSLPFAFARRLRPAYCRLRRRCRPAPGRRTRVPRGGPIASTGRDAPGPPFLRPTGRSQAYPCWQGQPAPALLRRLPPGRDARSEPGCGRGPKPPSPPALLWRKGTNRYCGSFPGQSLGKLRIDRRGRGRIGWPKTGIFAGFGNRYAKSQLVPLWAGALCVRSPCRGNNTSCCLYFSRSGFAPAIARCGLPVPRAKTAKKDHFLPVARCGPGPLGRARRAAHWRACPGSALPHGAPASLALAPGGVSVGLASSGPLSAHSAPPIFAPGPRCPSRSWAALSRAAGSRPLR
jgi:hypothetical protein